MLKNTKIRHLIVLAISMLLAALLIMGGLGIKFTSSIAQKTRILYDLPHTNVVNMWKVKTMVLNTGSQMREGMLSGGKYAPGVLDGVFEDIKEVEAVIQHIAKNQVDPNATKGDNSLDTAAKAWSADAQSIMDDISQGRVDLVPFERSQMYMEKEDALLTKLDSIIGMATANALNFRNGALAQANSSMAILGVVFLVALILAGVTMVMTLNRIAHPMRIMLDSARHIADGDLEFEITYRSSNEFGELADRFREMQDTLKTIVRDIDRVLYEMGQGNFTVESSAEYKGEFASIRESVIKINQNLSGVLQRINHSAEGVSGDAHRVSEHAQVLAQGATEQSSTVEELAANVTEIVGRIKDTAKHSKEARSKTQNAQEHVQLSSRRMKDMEGAMEEISHKSAEIGKIIKTIEDIAFQTNILALNAAVEAARAGTAGKGFAVVADEVRNLASKSGEAAKGTTDLISGTVQAVENGTSIASEASASLEAVVGITEEIDALVEQISVASSEEASASEQVMTSVEQISEVVKMNSATAEESAASSEQLSSEAAMLKKLVGDFVLCEETGEMR